jgi:hypothetical protein
VRWDRFQRDWANEFAVDGYREREFKRVIRVEPGDRFVYYIKRLGVFGAIAEARGRGYVDWSRLWQDGIYPLRFERCSLLVLPRASMLEAAGVLPQLSFISAKSRNGLSLGQLLRGDLRQISKQDFVLIEKAMCRRARGIGGQKR